jgi:succinate dehydrogenase / fumarate reductase iron-sulfur subunit
MEPTLVYRRACHHSACGTCACLINGTERLACTTSVFGLAKTTIELAPLRGFVPVADLAVEMVSFFKQIKSEWSHLRPIVPEVAEAQTIAGRPFQQFENCIECGCCVSACPVSHEGADFRGPAALTAIARQVTKQPSALQELLALAGDRQGVSHCRRHLACSRVCPTAAYPARYIQDLKRMLQKNQGQTP